ncbi:MAG: DUF1565 domain-containing protein, partial [Synechococcales bacterium]|nr:DUF1565 domain-containing protein [Synechococcales bacterium]
MNFVPLRSSAWLNHRPLLVSALLASSLLWVAPQPGLPQSRSVDAAPAVAPGESSSSAEYALLFVNSQQGNDRQVGSEAAPLKTITQALNIAQPNTIIVLASGLYSSETGETFPLQLKPGVTLQGEARDRGQSVIIRGSGFFLSKSFARQKVTIVGANRAGLRGVTVTNPEPQGYGLWIESSSPVISDNTFTGSTHDGVSIVGNSAPILRNNYFYSNGANGITIYGTSRPELRDNIVEKTGFGINIAQNAAPRLIGNRITQNKDGIVVQGNAQPILRSNVIDGNERDGLVAISQARPDLGSREDQGNNAFLNNGQSDVNAQAASQIIPAAGNQISVSRGRVDFNAIAGNAIAGNAIAGRPVSPLPPTARLSRPVPTAKPPAPLLTTPSEVKQTPESRVIPIAVPTPVGMDSARSPLASPGANPPAGIVNAIAAPTPEPGTREITFSRPAVDRSVAPATIRSTINLPTPRQAWSRPPADNPSTSTSPTGKPNPIASNPIAPNATAPSAIAPTNQVPPETSPSQAVLPVP